MMYSTNHTKQKKKKKKKLYDLRNERDVGNVIAYQLEQQPPPQSHLPSSHISHNDRRIKSENATTTTAVGSNDDDDDDQQRIFQQLSQSSRMNVSPTTTHHPPHPPEPSMVTSSSSLPPKMELWSGPIVMPLLHDDDHDHTDREEEEEDSDREDDDEDNEDATHRKTTTTAIQNDSHRPDRRRHSARNLHHHHHPPSLKASLGNIDPVLQLPSSSLWTRRNSRCRHTNDMNIPSYTSLSLLLLLPSRIESSSTTFSFQQRRLVFRILTQSILLTTPDDHDHPDSNHHHNQSIPSSLSSSSVSSQWCLYTLWKFMSYPQFYTIPTTHTILDRTSTTRSSTTHHHPTTPSSSINPTTTTTTTMVWSTKSLLLDRTCRQNGMDVLELLSRVPYTTTTLMNPDVSNERVDNDDDNDKNDDDDHLHRPTHAPTTNTLTTTQKDHVSQEIMHRIMSTDLVPPSRIGLRMDTLVASSSGLSKTIQNEILTLPPNTVLIPPTTDYVPMPGTIPPSLQPDTTTIGTNADTTTPTIQQQHQRRKRKATSPPVSPIILFGPTDRNEHIVHTGHLMDESIYKVTIASLLQQMSATYTSPTSSIELHSHKKLRHDHYYDDEDDITTKRTKTRTLLQTQLLSIVQQIVRTNQNLYYKRLLRQLSSILQHQSSTSSTPTTTITQTPIHNFELPLAYFYQSLMEYCSVILSGVVGIVSSSTTNRSDEDDDDDDEIHDIWDSTAPTNNRNMMPLIEQVFEFLEVHITHNGLQMFPKLHTIYGLMRICKMLPESGIAIMGQSFRHSSINKNGNNEDTPIQLFRILLEHLEDNHYLVSTQPSSSNRHILNVGELEYTLYRASMIFLNNCIQREPWNVQHHCWYIGTVASSLLLCSGQQIITTSTTINDIKTPRKQQQRRAPTPRRIVFPTIRRPLPKLQELRKQTALAFHELVELRTKYPNQHRMHSAITAFLEWDQVISLLLGPSMDSNRIPTKSYDMYYRHFRTLYQYHKEQWAFQENSTRAYISMRCTTHNDRGSDVYLHELASALEKDPSNIDHWHALVQTLGPIGSKNLSPGCPCTAKSTSSDSKCKECDCLVDGLIIDNETIAIRNMDITWWGYDRCRWWYECLLQPINSIVHSTIDSRCGGRITKRNLANSNGTILSLNVLKTSIRNQVKQLEPFKRCISSAESTSISPTDENITKDRTISPLTFQNWSKTFQFYIESTAGFGDDIYMNNATIKKRKKSNNSYVFVSFVQNGAFDTLSSCDYLDHVRNTHQNPNMSNADFVKSRLMGYKIVILGHLYSVAHLGIDVLVKQLYSWLASTTLNDNDRSHHPAYSILCWLYRMGLNITK